MPRHSPLAAPYQAQPQRVGCIELENRFVRSATYCGLADELGHVGDRDVERMSTLASKDVSLIITGYALPDP